MVNVWRGLFRRRPHSKDLEGAAAFLAELDAREGDLREWGETLTPSDFPVLEEVVPIDWKSTVIEGMGIGGRLPAGAVELLLYEHVGTEDLLFRHWNVEWRDGVFGQLELWTSY